MLEEISLWDCNKNGTFQKYPFLDRLVFFPQYQRYSKEQFKNKSNHTQINTYNHMYVGLENVLVLVAPLEKWWTFIDNKGFTGSVLMDLSKASETIILNYFELNYIPTVLVDKLF